MTRLESHPAPDTPFLLSLPWLVALSIAVLGFGYWLGSLQRPAVPQDARQMLGISEPQTTTLEFDSVVKH